MTCDRCFKPIADGEHGVGVCPFEPRSLSASIITDEIPGGPRMFENLGDKEVYISTKSQLRAELQARGLRECVRHVGVQGSDKSKETQRWI